MRAVFWFFKSRPVSGLPFIKLALVFLLFLNTAPVRGAENTKKPGGPPHFTWDLLWTGSWYKSIKTEDGESPGIEDLFDGGTLYNRGGITLGMPKLDLSFRFLATDKRLLPITEDDTKAGFNPGFGLYHNGSGSRLLWGVQGEYGLPARVKNIWLRSLPYMESRSPSSRDLKTEPAAKDESDAYLHLGLPQDILPGFAAFASAVLDNDLNPAFGGGLGLEISHFEFLLEGFFTRKELPPRKITTWFSDSPPLPERDFRIFALGFIFNSPYVTLAADWALSETFAWGRDMYGNAALTLGNKPWRFSLALDGAGSRFTDRNGSAAGSGFRLGTKGERYWPRSGLLRFQGTFRSHAVDEPFDRGSLSIYFRPSAPTAAEKRNNSFPVRFSRASLSMSRDARNPEKTADSFDALAGFSFGPLSAVFSCSLHCLSCLDDENETWPLFRPQFFEKFDSFKVSGEFSFKIGIFDLRTRLAYTARENKDPLWEPSINCSVKPGKWGRIGLRVASTDFPDKWEYTLSWRFTYAGKL